jgi:hypothetical membrane protein
VTVFGQLQFVLVSVLAMPFYEGGTFFDPTTVGYRFWENFLSDLGMEATHSGVANPTGSLLFNVSLVVQGLSQIPLWLAWNRSAERSRGLVRASTVLGVMSALGVVGVGFTPFDTLPDEHVAAVALWLFAFVPALALRCVAAARAGRGGSWGTRLTALLAVLCVVQIVQGLSGQSPAMVATQKVLVYFMIGWFVGSSLSLLRRSDPAAPRAP